MRIASSPNLRIAAGLPFAALLSIVGFRIFRRWISHGLEVLLERADDLSWLENWDLVADSAYRAPGKDSSHQTCSHRFRAQEWAERLRIHQDFEKLDSERESRFCGWPRARPKISFCALLH
jgi:hypothetical protein